MGRKGGLVKKVENWKRRRIRARKRGGRMASGEEAGSREEERSLSVGHLL